MQTIQNINFIDDKQLYCATKIKLEQSQNLQDLLPFIQTLLTIHDLKLLLHQALDKMKNLYVDTNEDIHTNKEEHNKIQIKNGTYKTHIGMKSTENIRSVYMSIGSIDELLPHDVLINILSYLNTDNEYAKLPCVSKQFHIIMTTYPNIYNNYSIEICDNPISEIAFKRKKTNIQFNIDHNENEIWIGNKYSQNQAYGGVETDYIPFPNEDIWKCTFPWHAIKKWYIKCSRRSWLPSTNHIGGNKKIIQILNKSQHYIRCINFHNPAHIKRINNYPIFSKVFSVQLNGEIIDNINWLNSFNKFPLLKCLEIGPLTLNYYCKQSKNNRREKYNIIKQIIDKCPKLIAISIIQEDRPKEDIFTMSTIGAHIDDEEEREDKYIEWIMPSTLEFLQIHRVICNINISYCNHIIGFSVENIKKHQIKFSDHGHEASIDCFLCYDDTYNNNNNNRQRYIHDQEKEEFDIGFDFHNSLLPIQFIGYKNDKKNNALRRCSSSYSNNQYFDDYDTYNDDHKNYIPECKNELILSPTQIIINYLKKIEINNGNCFNGGIDNNHNINVDVDDEIIENMLIGNNINVNNLRNVNNGKIYIKMDSFAKIVNTIIKLNTNYTELQQQIYILQDKIQFLEINQQSFDNIKAAVTLLNILMTTINHSNAL
eukprot:174630_1